MPRFGIQLHNTLTGKKEVFESLKLGVVKLYSCGPTVYDYAHIGNFRSFLAADLLFRVLQYAGYEVQKVQNITDVGHLTNDDLADADGEDKILKKARVQKKDPFEIARFFEDAFVEDESILRIIPPNAGRPRATDFIVEQLTMIKDLITKGFAYEVNGSVYFRTNKFSEYGKLSKNSLEDLVAGARVEINHEKENPLDFALWKSADEDHLMQWDFLTGEHLKPGFKDTKNPGSVQPGFPGWHIECSAMSQKLLGDNFDIHTGGEDNIFPHHECEIAQNECSHGGKISYWLHAKHLLVGGQKMSKSKGNFYTIRDLLDKGYTGAEIRYLLISAHYRTALNFTIEGLDMARASMARLSEARRILHQLAGGTEVKDSSLVFGAREKYQAALEDDLNTAEALGVVFDLIKTALKKRDERTLTSGDAASIIRFLDTDFAMVFDIFPEEKSLSGDKTKEIEALIAERDQARTDKNWARADEIRNELLEQGIELFDEAGKTNWRVKS
jgi:cysteinyl-tRNA synthetase